MAPKFVVGVALSLGGCCLLSLGLNVEKLSILKNADLPKAAQRIFYKQWRWVCGFGIFLAGNILNATALGYASASLLAPLGSFSIIANMFCSWLLIGEHVTTHDVLCTLVIVAGAFLAVLPVTTNIFHRVSRKPAP